MNVNSLITKDYKNVPLRRRGENKPNQSQFPKSQNALKKDYTASGRAGQEKIKAPIIYGLRKMGGTGLEPVTSCVSSRRSSQLS